MVHLDTNIFISNLRITQAYCSEQMNKMPLDIATVFRSINPIIQGKPIFSFSGELFDMEPEPGIRFRSPVVWAVDPLDRGNEHLIDDLFDLHISFKNKMIVASDKMYHGNILVANIDDSVTDGASEYVSMGLIDTYDIPPIDTWFYLKELAGRRILFAWIPEKLKHYANEAILVNCVDCLGWFNEWYPQEYEAMAQAQPLNI
jgi:hypothetical protein